MNYKFMNNELNPLRRKPVIFNLNNMLVSLITDMSAMLVFRLL